MSTETPDLLTKISTNLTVRFFAVAFLALLMAIPLGMIRGTVFERSGLYRQVQLDIARSWGADQTVVGPVLVVPWRIDHPAVPKTDGFPARAAYSESGASVVMPKTLDMDVDLEPQRLHRGIHDVVVYTATAALTGDFEELEFPDPVGEGVLQVQWEAARVVVGLSDPTAVATVGTVALGSARGEFMPDTQHHQLVGSGFQAELEGFGPDQGDASFSVRLVAKGSGGFSFAAVGRSTTTEVASSWPHPKFVGSPTTRDIGADGFTGRWELSHLTSSVPRRFELAEGVSLLQHTVGVELIEPVDLYAKIERSTKHGMLFITTTFLLLLLFELAPTIRLHPVQYGLVGIALALFYMTLLSLAEHVSFAVAYGAAASVVVTMVTLYVWAALRSLGRAAVLAAMLSALYGILFAVLRMEDLALLTGTAVLLGITAVAMFLTRGLGRVDVGDARRLG